MKDQVLFPKIAVREKGFLQVSDIHTIYDLLGKIW